MSRRKQGNFREAELNTWLQRPEVAEMLIELLIDARRQGEAILTATRVRREDLDKRIWTKRLNQVGGY